MLRERVPLVKDRLERFNPREGKNKMSNVKENLEPVINNLLDELITSTHESIARSLVEKHEDRIPVLFELGLCPTDDLEELEQLLLESLREL